MTRKDFDAYIWDPIVVFCLAMLIVALAGLAIRWGWPVGRDVCELAVDWTHEFIAWLFA